MSPISVQTAWRTLLALVLLLNSAQCSPERHFTFAPLPPPRFSSSGSATVGAPPVRLAIGDIEVRAEAAHGARQGMGPVWEPARSELEAYLQERLVSDSSFGAWVPRRRDADFVVDIDVTIAEQSSINGWFGLGVALELATVLTGAAVGAALVPRSRGVGALFGTVTSLVPAVLLAFMPPSMSIFGTLDGHVTLRRVSDGIVIDRRHVRLSWRRNASVYSGPGRLAIDWGRAGEQMAHRLRDTLARAIEDRPVIAPAEQILPPSVIIPDPLPGR